MSLPGTSRTLGDVLWREAIRGPISLSTPCIASGSCIAVKPATPGDDDLQQYYLRLSSTSFDCAKWRSVHGKEINPMQNNRLKPELDPSALRANFRASC